MPFTTSHPAIVMPLKMLWPRHFSLSGLMAGAVSPDLLYFLTGTTEFRYLSHTWPGFFLLCVPLGVLFTWAFHAFFKRPVINHLPHLLKEPLSGLAATEFRVDSAREITVMVTSILIGALSHFAWDSITNPEGFVVARVDFLMDSVTILGVSRPVCRIVQHASSLFGGLAVLLLTFKGGLLPKPVASQDSIPASRKLLFWLGAVAGAGLGAYLSALLWSSWFGFTLTYQHSDSTTMISAALGSWAGFYWYAVLVGLITRIRD